MFNPISCGKCIAKIGMDIQGHDPRSWIKSAVWQCVSDGKVTAGHFKKILERKIRKEIRDISDPERYCEEIWNKLKHKCSG